MDWEQCKYMYTLCSCNCFAFNLILSKFWVIRSYCVRVCKWRVLLGLMLKSLVNQLWFHVDEGQNVCPSRIFILNIALCIRHTMNILWIAEFGFHWIATTLLLLNEIPLRIQRKQWAIGRVVWIRLRCSTQMMKLLWRIIYKLNWAGWGGGNHTKKFFIWTMRNVCLDVDVDV